MHAVTLAACSLLLAACSGEPGPVASGQQARGDQTPAALPALDHDFGVIPHGQSRQHEFQMDLARLGSPCIPLHVHLDCSCGRADMRIRAPNGRERAVDGTPNPDNTVRPDETLVVRVVVDTITREAADLPGTIGRGHVLLQPVDDRDGTRRVQWPLLLRYGIDAPVVVHPFTALDFGRVPVSLTPEILTTLRGDAQHPVVQFGRVTASDPEIEAFLEPANDHVVLRARVRPGELGHHRGVVSVATDLPDDYHVNLGVTWKVVPDLEATPTAKISFRVDTRREQRDEEAAGQFVLVTDHDVRRAAEFVVREVVDDHGQDASTSFAITLRPVPGQPRQHRLLVRYLGGRPAGFRGRIVLGKSDVDGPLLPIDLVVFANRNS